MRTHVIVFPSLAVPQADPDRSGLVLGAGVDGRESRPGPTPALELTQRRFGRRARLGRVRDDHEASVGGELESLEGQRQIPDQRVVEALGPRPVEADVVAGPADAELLAAR